MELKDLEPFVTSGSRGWAEFYSERGLPFVRITNMSRSSIYLDLTDLKLVNLPAGEKEGTRTALRVGDVLVSITADIGIVAYVDASLPTPAFINQHIALVRFDPAKADARFVSYFLAGERAQRRFRSSTDVGAKAGMSLLTVRKLGVALPTLPEQRAIAAALRDVDALLASLDKLIAKKRDLKQAAMQQLLNGQTRLPGFSGSWQTKPLGAIAPLQRGFDLPTSKVQRGRYPVVYSNGILNHHAHFQVRGPGVVTGRSGTIGKVTFVAEDYWPHNTALWVTNFKGSDPRFIYYLYGAVGFDRFATGSGVPTLNRNDVHAFRVAVPEPPEQRSIAAVLSDMDAELVALETRREKTRAIKQGMMQELLTGRTRLV
ncbi:MAG: restriction endonuclease subunit S [Archangiaceae bacterium]|nr:restriction endonuclease subunit S [Archangiaceae bacterium]